MLVDYPQAGQSRPELSPGLRSIAVATYTIFYRVEPHAIQIVRILSGYRDLAGQDFPKD
jgi:toxin ParE1/3/4